MSWLKVSIYFAVSIVLTGILVLIAMLIALSLPIISNTNLEKIISLTWQPNEGYFGILPMLGGSFFLAIFALCIAWP